MVAFHENQEELIDPSSSVYDVGFITYSNRLYDIVQLNGWPNGPGSEVQRCDADSIGLRRVRNQKMKSTAKWLAGVDYPIRPCLNTIKPALRGLDESDERVTLYQPATYGHFLSYYLKNGLFLSLKARGNLRRLSMPD